MRTQPKERTTTSKRTALWMFKKTGIFRLDVFHFVSLQFLLASANVSDAIQQGSQKMKRTPAMAAKKLKTYLKTQLPERETPMAKAMRNKNRIDN